jgi:hypothetical protein
VILVTLRSLIRFRNSFPPGTTSAPTHSLGARPLAYTAGVRIYEGAPREHYEEVLRSVGALLDQRGMREILIAETAEGYLVQGLAVGGGEGEAWTDPGARVAKESFNLLEDDIARFMDEGVSRRSISEDPYTHFYENALRVLGHYFDEQKPRDIFLFEQDRAFVVRLLMSTAAGPRHALAEFTREDIEKLIEAAPTLRETAG